MTRNKHLWPTLLLSLGISFSVLSLFIPWTTGTWLAEGLDSYPWGAVIPEEGSRKVHTWFSEETADGEGEFGSTVTKMRLSMMGSLAGLMFAGAALLTVTRNVTSATFALGSAVVNTTAILLFMSGMNPLVSAMGSWSGGLFLGWASVLLVAAGAVTSLILVQQDKDSPAVVVGMRVGTSQGEGTVVGVSDQIHVQLDGRSDLWMFQPRDVHVVIRRGNPPDWVKNDIGQG